MCFHLRTISEVCAFAERSITRRLTFLSPSFFNPSWCNYCNFRRSSSRSLNNSTCHQFSFISNISTCFNLLQHFRLGHPSLKRSMTRRMEFFLAVVIPSLVPAFCSFGLRSGNFTIHLVTWAFHSPSFLCSVSSFIFAR